MLDRLTLYNELKETLDPITAERLAGTLSRIYEEVKKSVTKTEFNDLRASVATKTDFSELREIVRDLAEAQKRTELRVEELAQAQQELAEAQKELIKAQMRTDHSIDRLNKQVGGLSDAIGGDIEDIAYIVLYEVLKREFGWQVGVLERRWQLWEQHPEEVNVFGQATDPARPNATIWIVGEAKHNLTAREVKKFIKQLERARKHLRGEIFPVCFCYRARPEVQQLVTDAGIRLAFSYGKLV
jgi:predicted CopG family antitoxin